MNSTLWTVYIGLKLIDLYIQNVTFLFSSAGEKSDSSGSSGSESPNRGKSNAENRAQTWLGTLNGIESENGRCANSFPLVNCEGVAFGQNSHEQENQYYYRSGFIK